MLQNTCLSFQIDPMGSFSYNQYNNEKRACVFNADSQSV